MEHRLWQTAFSCTNLTQLSEPKWISSFYCMQLKYCGLFSSIIMADYRWLIPSSCGVQDRSKSFSKQIFLDGFWHLQRFLRFGSSLATSSYLLVLSVYLTYLSMLHTRPCIASPGLNQLYNISSSYSYFLMFCSLCTFCFKCKKIFCPTSTFL